MGVVKCSNLRFARDDFKFSTRGLAEKLNIDSGNLSRYELGKRNIPNDLIVPLASLLDCTCEFIIQESDFGMYAYYQDKRVVLSIKQYKDLESKNLMEVIDYKRIISSDEDIKNLIPLVYGISKN